MMERKMFNKAGALGFQRAKELRQNMTHAEMILWGYLKTRPYGYKFRRQHPFGRFIADFFCYKLRLVIEVDGSIHDVDEIKMLDTERQKEIEAEGIRVIRFTNNEILQHLEKVIKEIETLLHDASSSTRG